MLQKFIVIALTIIISLFVGIYIGISYGKQKRAQREIADCDKETDPNNELDTRKAIIENMESLRERINVDFIGLAIYDAMNDEIRWRLAVGESNTRYKRIVIRMGKGIAGEAIQLNRTIKVENFPHDVLGNPIEYPILLVEHLKSSIAVPVADSRRIYGVLLVGQRSERKYTEIEENETSEIAGKIANELARANIYSRVVQESVEDINEFINKKKINDSLFISYLEDQKEKLPEEDRGGITFEVLDQSILEIPNHVQEMLIANTIEILSVTNKEKEDRSNISILRDENNLLIEVTVNGSFTNTKVLFANVYSRIGEIGGSIISYHDQNELHFVMQLPVWSYKNPLL